MWFHGSFDLWIEVLFIAGFTDLGCDLVVASLWLLLDRLYFYLQVCSMLSMTYISCLKWSYRYVSLSLMVCMISDLLTYLLISSTYFLKPSTYTFISDLASVDTTEEVEEFSMPLALVLTNYFCPPFMLCWTISFLLIVYICWLNYSFIFRRFSSSSLLNCVISSLITRSSLEILINSRFRISCSWWSMISPNISVISSTIFWPSTGRLPSTIDQGYFPAFSKAKVGSSVFYSEVRWTPSTHRWTYAKNF